MDIRVLKYFLKVCELENITKAAQALHTSQPNLSRQLKQLEEELGQKLLIRDKKSIRLTEEGRYLRQQALTIVNMTTHTESVLKSFKNDLNGEVFIGAAESIVMTFIGAVFQESWDKYPGIKYHLNSGNYADVTQDLDAGLADFGIVVESTNMEKYNYLKLPLSDTWGVLMHKDSPLAKKKQISSQDLAGLPLVASREIQEIPKIKDWASEQEQALNIIATFNLITNAALMINHSWGYALTFEGVTFPSESNHLVFRPLAPAVHSDVYLIWRKFNPMSQSAQVFLDLVRRHLDAFEK